ncbi:MAG: DoxX family membrane protein [Alphaproteobacteria bacterium]|nr:DoxX family membrane protein [Alphaproteobacteria bacterium]
MTKTISIYGVQVALGAIALVAGYAKLSGAGPMAQQFQALGLGYGFLFAAGTAEILAGLCLLLPRGGILGAVLLSCVMVGALGVTIGHVASTVAAHPHSPQFTATAIAKQSPAERIVIVRPRAAWDI